MKKIVLQAALMVFSVSALLASDPVKTMVKTDESKIEWKGKKITGQHEGLIDISEGSLEFDGAVLTGGSFVIDMSTISCTDLDGGMKGKLEGHLKSDDFFGVMNHPTANLVLKKVVPVGTTGDYKVSADLTIKNITKEIKFYANLDSSTNAATAEITVDRSDFDVRYGSGSFFSNLGDNAIYDEFHLNVHLSY